MSSAGLDYFANLNKYKGEATASMDTYRNHALEKVKEKNKGVQEKIDAVQKAGLGVSALGIAMKSINKQIPKEWLNYDSGNVEGYNFQGGGNHLHSTQMKKGGGDGLHYEVPEENFNSSRQPRPGDRMRSAIEPEEGIYERLTEPTNLDSNVSSQIPDTDAETNVDVASPRATQVQGEQAETNIDLASPRVDTADVEPNSVDVGDGFTQQTYQARGGSETGAGPSENVMTEDQARQFTQEDNTIYEDAIDSEIQVGEESEIQPAVGPSRQPGPVDVENRIAGDIQEPYQTQPSRPFDVGDIQDYSNQIQESKGSGVNLVDRRIVRGKEYPSFLEEKAGADPTQPIHPTKNPGGVANKGGSPPQSVAEVQNSGGSAITAEDQAKLDQLTDGATEAENLLQQDKDAVGEVAGKESAVAGEGAGESGGIAGDVAGDLAGDALMGEAGGEEAVAVGIDAAGMASGVGEAVGAALLLGSLAYELSQSSVMKGKEDTAEKAMPTQAASYGGADIQSTGATGRGIV